MNNNIIWKDVPIGEFKNTYEISNTGLIRNKKTYQIKTVRLGSTGYNSCNFDNGTLQKTVQVHTLIAKAFIDSIPEKKTIKLLLNLRMEIRTI